MKKYVIAITLCIIQASGLVYAESLKPAVSYLSNYVRDIAEDGDYLWLASDAGLVKFNKTTGERIFYTEENSDIPSDNTRSVSVIDGDVWVGTNISGIGIFDGVSWDSLTTSNSEIPTMTVRNMWYTNPDSVWVTGGRWASLYQQGTWESYEVFDLWDSDSWYTLSIIQDPLNRVWIGTSFGLYTIKNNMAVLYDAVPRGFVYNFVVSEDSTLWFGGPEGGLISIHEDSIETFSMDNSDLPFLGIMDLVFDFEEKLWIGGSALAVKDGDTWQMFDADDCASLDRVLCMHCDTDNVIWIGTFENGLIRFDGETWTQYDIIPGVTGIEEPSDTPRAIDLLPAYPNPFNPSTTISYTLPEAADVTLRVHSVTGQQVAVLTDEYMGAGSHSIVFDGEGLASGMYFYRLETAGVVKTEKMLLVK